MKTLEEFKTRLFEELKDLYPQGELATFFLLTAMDLMNIPKEDIHAMKKELLKPADAAKLPKVIEDLKTHKPIQYVLGVTEFCGCKLRVNEHVLIPRPETEELVHEVVKAITPVLKGESQQSVNILDIGTGSGCIAIALKKKLPEATVSAIDISDEALLIAKANALLNLAKINFLQADILQVNTSALKKDASSPLRGGGLDIIVSNPPYVRKSEKDKMDKNVLNYEPHLALFVNDNDPLLFYKAITEFALQSLAPNGRLYFEINEALGPDIKKLLEAKGFKNVEVKKDISGKDRIATGIR